MLADEIFEYMAEEVAEANPSFWFHVDSFGFRVRKFGVIHLQDIMKTISNLKLKNKYAFEVDGQILKNGKPTNHTWDVSTDDLRQQKPQTIYYIYQIFKTSTENNKSVKKNMKDSSGVVRMSAKEKAEQIADIAAKNSKNPLKKRPL